MPEYDAHGVRFQYPETWTLDDESSDEKVAVTVQSDGTAFWTLAVFVDAPKPERVIESVVAAYREDYPELDVYPLTTTPGPHGPVSSREIEFVCLELIATAKVEAYQIGDRTAMILFQCADAELETQRPILDAMTASLRIGGDPPSPSLGDLFSP